MKNKFLFFLFFSFCLVFVLKMVAFSATTSSPKIQAIIIQGHDKIEEAAIKKKLISKKGARYDIDNIREDVNSLFNMGFFYNIVVEKKRVKRGVALTYHLVEKPQISIVEYEGNFEIKEDELKEASEIKPYEILNRSQLNKAVKQLLKLYEEKGFLLAQVNYRIEGEGKDKKEKSVKVVFNIQENKRVNLKKITFLGNKFFSSEKLKSILFTKEQNFFSFLQKEKAYKKEIFERDVQILNHFYYNEGFVQVLIDKPEVYISPDKRFIYITLHITEGERFKFGNIKFSGDLIFSYKHLLDITRVKKGDFFSYQKIQEDLKSLQEEYGNLGYAFVNPIPYTSLKEKEKVVDINFKIEKGKKVYINEIHIFGNSRTRDKVIRREMRIHDGELYHETRRRRSLANIKRLGFFEEVDFLNKVIPGSEDTIDIHVRVKERNTGAIEAGLSYSSQTGFQLQGKLHQSNFLGYGQAVQFSVAHIRKYSVVVDLSFLDFYFLDTNWEFGVDLYFKKYENLYGRYGILGSEFYTQQVGDSSILDYSQKRLGSRIQVGYPFSDDWRWAFSYKLEHFNLNWDPIWKEKGITFLEKGVLSSVTGSISYDKRNDRFLTTEGLYFRNSVEMAGLGGDLKFMKNLTTLRYFKTLFWDFVWRNNLNYGFLYFGHQMPSMYITEMFRLGGSYNLRGYNFYSIGETQYEVTITDKDGKERDRVVLGGTQQLYYQSEFQVPLVREAKLYGALFYDIGSAGDRLHWKSFYYNWGFGFRVFTPIAPIRVEWAFPIKKVSSQKFIFLLSMEPPF